MAATILLLRRFGASLLGNEPFRLAALAALTALELDWATKSWALHALTGPMPLGDLTLGVEHNTAFAFSTGAGAVSRELVAAVRLLAVTALVLMAGTLGLRERRHAAGLGLIVGGGLGNSGDLLFRTHGVVDFIGAGPFALRLGGQEMAFGLIFNIADLSVLIGIALLAPLIRLWAIAAHVRIRQWQRRWLAGES